MIDPPTTTTHSHTMTRTERSQSLRALAKDRSGSRNGMDMSTPKGGAGAYNWGSIDSEFRYEDDALLDEAADFEDQAKETGCKPFPASVLPSYIVSCLLAAPNPTSKKPAAVRRTSNVTDQDRENAIKVRKNALKSDGSTFFHTVTASSTYTNNTHSRRPGRNCSLFCCRLQFTPQGYYHSLAFT